MKISTNYLKTLLVATSLITLTSCGKDDSTTPTNNDGGSQNRTGSVDSYYIGNWLSDNAALPSTYKDNYSKFELELKSDAAYSWKWHKKSGSITDYTGYITTTKHDEKHTTGYNLWSISINVTEINGKPTPGGWVGLYTFDDGGNTLILSVEPNVSGVTAPTVSGGIGSGSSGMDAVYVFKYQN